MSGSGLPFRQFVLKVCSRCDLACDHCYVYEHADQSWRGQPKVMTDDVVARTAEAIAEHARDHALPEVRVILHGGEPLLAGAARLGRICETLRREIEKACRLDLRIHTNGVRLDDEFLKLFSEHQVKIGISIDGDRAANDRHRRYASGRSSYDQVVRAIGRLRDDQYRALYLGLLCTIDVRNDPKATYDALVALNPPVIDFLFPHGTWDCPPPDAGSARTPYADWLIAIFDHWNSAPVRVPVRLFESIIRTTYGGSSLTEAIGLSAIDVAVVETDGSIQQADSLKVAFDGAPATGLDIFGHTLAEAALHPGITARQQGLAGLCAACRGCPVVRTCGGGMYAHRFRTGTGFDNPSVYCADLMKLIAHVRRSLAAGRDRPAHVIPAGYLDDLAAGYGGETAIGYLAESQRSLGRGLLGLLYQRISERGLAAGYLEIFQAAWELLVSLDAQDRAALDGILAYPYVRTWAVHCTTRLDAPDADGESLAQDAAHLAAIAAAAAIRLGRRAAVRVPVRAGRLHLPGLGFLSVRPGGVATIVTSPDGFELKDRPGGIAIARAAGAGQPVAGSPEGWHPIRTLTAGGVSVTLEDTDPYRDCHQWAAAPRLSADEAASWQDRYAQAMALIERDHGAYYPGLAAGLSTIMPLANDQPGREISAAARQAFGAVGVALPADAASLALLLVHEFQHVKLGAILDLLELCDPSEPRLFYAPWRDDPRPLEALLQGSYAHIAVADFWRLRRHHLSGPEAEDAAARFARWRMQTAEAIQTLLSSGSLTPRGERFVEGMRATVVPWFDEVVPESASRMARERAGDHRQAWGERFARHPLRAFRPGPAVTRADMARDLRALGLAEGRTVLVGASLSRIGWVDGGAETVVAALRDVLGPDGTLVVPTGTSENSDTSRAYLSRIAEMSETEIEEFRAAMPAFDRYATPSTGMGRIAEAVRTHPGSVRSDHPQTSFAALGPMAAALTDGHALTCHLGEDSPLGKLYLMDRREFARGPGHPAAARGQRQATALVLLMGVDFATCTALHLAEYLYTAQPPVRSYRCVIADGPARRWVEYEDVVLDDSDFEIIGKSFEQTGTVRTGLVGGAPCQLVPLCEIVNFAAQWMRDNRCD